MRKEYKYMLEETVITLSRLNCSGCVGNVTNALQALPSVEVLRSDIATKMVQIRYSSDQVSLDTIKTALSEANYPVVAFGPVEFVQPELFESN
jgi:copper chaperone CopZ